MVKGNLNSLKSKFERFEYYDSNSDDDAFEVKYCKQCFYCESRIDHNVCVRFDREAGGRRTSPDKRSCLLFKDKKEAEEEERIGNKSW